MVIEVGSANSNVNQHYKGNSSYTFSCGHEIVKCSYCSTIMSQCRCLNGGKVTRLDVCKKCFMQGYLI